MAQSKKSTSKGLGKGLGRGLNALIPEDDSEVIVKEVVVKRTSRNKSTHISNRTK